MLRAYKIARFYWGFRVLLGSGTPWRRVCSGLSGATRYQVVNSTDGVSGYQGEEGNRTVQGATDDPTAVAPFLFCSSAIFHFPLVIFHLSLRSVTTQSMTPAKTSRCPDKPL